MKTIAEFEEQIAQKLRPWFIRNISLDEGSDCLNKIISRHPKLLCIMNHGGFYGPWAAALTYHYLFLSHGGAKRTPTGVAWRGFYKLPIYKQIAQYLTQLEHPLDYSGCTALLTESRFNDLIILPEGANCHYFNGQVLQPFISPRFIELSIETQTPLLLFVHHGSEHWSVPIRIPAPLLPLTQWLPERYRLGLERSHSVNIPHMLKGSIPELSVTCKLYQPSIHPSALRDKAFAKTLIAQESETIHQLMQHHYNRLKIKQMSEKSDAFGEDEKNSVFPNQNTHPCVEVA
jgi:hypothetical protein